MRAQTWEDAYGICEDEFFPEATETIEEIIAEYNVIRRHANMIRDNGTEREAVYPGDYPNGKLAPHLEFVRWDTIETPTDEEGAFVDNVLFQEAFGFRPNGANAKDVLNHGIYSKDLNGDSLELLTPELAAALEITLEITSNE